MESVSSRSDRSEMLETVLRSLFAKTSSKQRLVHFSMFSTARSLRERFFYELYGSTVDLLDKETTGLEPLWIGKSNEDSTVTLLPRGNAKNINTIFTNGPLQGPEAPEHLA